MAAIRHLGFHIFAKFVKNSNSRLLLRRCAKFGEHRTFRGRVVCFRFSKLRPSAILDFHMFTIFVKNSNLHLFLRRLAKFGEGWTISTQVIAYFRFQDVGHPPSWIWYDVIADHPWLVFDCPNILLKLQWSYTVHHQEWLSPVEILVQTTTVFSCKENETCGEPGLNHGDWNNSPVKGNPRAELWFHYDILSLFCILEPHVGSRIVRIDPLRFLTGCRKRRLNQALSVLSLTLGFFWCMCCAVN